MKQVRVRVRPRVAWLPRAGHADADYEDAFAVPSPGGWPYRAAVADGATETAFAAWWARALVEGYVAGEAGSPAALAAMVEGRRAAWQAAVADVLPAGPWYLADKVREGAAAALLGLTLHEQGTWQALAVGDCCLFHVRGGQVHLRWPVADPSGFGHRPALVHSRSGPKLAVEERTGIWHPGDRFVLATDALAAWLMTSRAEAHWTEENFADRIAHDRTRGLRNDDVTLVVIDLDPDPGASLARP
ncbi:MAG: hypothetical protein D6746_07415 [Bacteroidetes bacterium]|nr:MAG: hypothetical protein D6746_07415 [Bacteroidota bacterium]